MGGGLRWRGGKRKYDESVPQGSKTRQGSPQAKQTTGLCNKGGVAEDCQLDRSKKTKKKAKEEEEGQHHLERRETKIRGSNVES